MNDLQIEYFLTVAKHLSFTKAAKELYVSQPAISRQILSMEEELGHTLFERNNKSVKLTEAGEMFFNFFTDYKNDFNNVKIHAQLISEGRQRVLRLGIIDSWDISPFFIDVIKKFREMHSQVRIELHSFDVYDMEEALTTDAVDIAMTIEPDSGEYRGITSINLASIPRVLLYSENLLLDSEKNQGSKDKIGQKQSTRHRESVKELQPADFSEETFLVVTGEEPWVYGLDLVKGFCRPYGFVPKVQGVNSTDAMVAGIQCEMGVAIVDSWNRALQNKCFKHIVLNSSHMVRLMWKTKWCDQVIEDFVKCLKEQVDKAGRKRK